MPYQGMIKQSRTLDLTAISQILDAMALSFLAYSPEQLGIGIPIYMALRTIINGLQAYLRFKTNGPVNSK